MKIKFSSVMREYVVLNIGILLNFVTFLITHGWLMNIAKTVHKNELGQLGSTTAFLVSDEHFFHRNRLT